MTDSEKFEQSKLIRCLPQRPEILEVCLVNINLGFTHIDDDFAYKADKFKMRLGRAVKKHCSNNAMAEFDSWKNNLANVKYVPIAVEEALRRREILKESHILDQLVGIFPSDVNENFEFLITNDPIDLVNMSTGTDWSSCTKIGGVYGNAREWLRSGDNCNWCTDIEHGNLLLVIRWKDTGLWAGRKSLRWCVKDYYGNHGIGLEDWYTQGGIPADVEEEAHRLINELAEESDLSVSYNKCVTPYYFGGTSDVGGSEGHIEYKIITDAEGIVRENPMIKDIKSVIPEYYRDVVDPHVDNIYLYYIGKDGTFSKFASIWTDHEEAYRIAHIIEMAKEEYNGYYTTDITELRRPIVRTMEKLMKEKNWIALRDSPIKFIYNKQEWSDWLNVDDCAKPPDQHRSHGITKGNRMINTLIEHREQGIKDYKGWYFPSTFQSLGMQTLPLLAIKGHDRKVPENLHPEFEMTDIQNPFQWSYGHLIKFADTINHAYHEDNPSHQMYLGYDKEPSELHKKIAGVIKRHLPSEQLYEAYAKEYPFYKLKKLIM